MKKIIFFILASCMVMGAQAQIAKDWSKIDLSGRPSDHLMFQYGSDSWTGKPDSIRTGNGLSRHFNFYIFTDKPFKNNARFSLGLGVGLSGSHIFMNNTSVGISANTPTLRFINVDSANHFKKMKVTTIYAEVPVELRYFSNPEHPGSSWKAAIGIKVGTLLKSYTKGKNLVTKAGSTVYGATYILKESNKRFFNGTMLAATGRIGYGSLSLWGSYQLNGVLRDGTGPSMHKVSVGVAFSGL